jgi:hypothetical protein
LVLFEDAVIILTTVALDSLCRVVDLRSNLLNAVLPLSQATIASHVCQPIFGKLKGKRSSEDDASVAHNLTFPAFRAFQSFLSNGT